MSRAIIVDDEPAQRMGIARHVHWKELGFEPPIQAQSADEAIRLIRENGIKTVITDVCMPGMDGIEMLHLINGIYNDINIIIISGYDEFEFARAAIEEGARAYLLKPIRVEEIEKWLAKFHEETLLRQKIEEKDSHFKQAVKVGMDLARGKFLESLLMSYNTEENYITSMSKSLGLPCGRFNCIIMTIIICNFYDVMRKSPEDGSTLTERIKSAIDATFEDEEFVLFTPLKLNRMVSVICNSKEQNMDIFVQRLEIMCSTAHDNLGVNLAIVLDSANIAWNEVHKLYKKSVTYLSYLGTQIGGQVLYVEKDEQHERDFLPSYYSNEMSKAISVEDVEATVSLSEAMFSNAQDVSFGNLQALVFSITGELMQALIKMNAVNDQVRFEMWQDLMASDNFSKLHETFSNILNAFVACISEKQKGTKHFIIDRAVKYIDANYQKAITVQNLASYLHINSSYLSVLFKKEMEQTISDYISDKRIKKAEECLHNTDMKIYDIATYVGYQTPSYFSYRFKKNVGCTPAEFRERKL
ncbi:MAG: response regulator [Clostridiales bacterium]|nr:response regulator [Clostridiales bacterium]